MFAQHVHDLGPVLAQDHRVTDHLRRLADHPARPQPLQPKRLRHRSRGDPERQRQGQRDDPDGEPRDEVTPPRPRQTRVVTALGEEPHQRRPRRGVGLGAGGRCRRR